METIDEQRSYCDVYLTFTGLMTYVETKNNTEYVMTRIFYFMRVSASPRNESDLMDGAESGRSIFEVCRLFVTGTDELNTVSS